MTKQKELAFMRRDYELVVAPPGVLLPQFDEAIRLYPLVSQTPTTDDMAAEAGAAVGDDSSPDAPLPELRQVGEFSTFPWRMAFGSGEAWIVRSGAFTGSLVRIDFGERLEARKVSGVPRGSILAVEGTNLWIKTVGLVGVGLHRLSKETGKEFGVLPGKFSDAAYGDGKLWALRMDGRLVEVDRMNMRETRTLELEHLIGRATDPCQRKLYFSGKALWLVELSKGTQVYIAVEPDGVGPFVCGAVGECSDGAADCQGLWMVSAKNGRVTRTDARSRRLTIEFDLRWGCEAMALGNDHLWVVHTTQEYHHGSSYRYVSTIDMKTHRISRTRVKMGGSVRLLQLGFHEERLWMLGNDGRLRVFEVPRWFFSKKSEQLNTAQLQGLLSSLVSNTDEPSEEEPPAPPHQRRTNRFFSTLKDLEGHDGLHSGLRIRNCFLAPVCTERCAGAMSG